MEASSTHSTQGGGPGPVALWEHMFGDHPGLLQIWTGIRQPDGQLEHFQEIFHSYPGAVETAAEWAIEKAAEGRDVYFSAHLLDRAKRSKETATEITCLWADLDGASVPNERLTPTAVVESSPGHFHAYWRLSDSIPPLAAEDLNKRLARAVGADPSGFDLSQLLRVPGTPNHKYPDEPLVTVQDIDPTLTYVPGELDKHLPSLPGVALVEDVDQDEEPPVSLSPAALRVWRGADPKYKENGEVDRSATLVKIGRTLYNAGANKATVIAGIKERDVALGYRKYADRSEAEQEKRYAEIFTELVANGRSAELTHSRNGMISNNSVENDSNDSMTAMTAGFAGLVELPDPTPFPLEALPLTVRRFVREAAQSIDCAADFVGISALAVLSGAIGDTHRILVKKGWTESASLYAAMVGPPASKKTPAMLAALVQTFEGQYKQGKRYEEKKEEYKRELRRYKARSKEEQAEEDPPRKPVFERTWVDDTTVERLAGILNENPRGVVLARDELSGWLRSMDQYKQGGKGSDRQFWLSVHTNRPAVVDRKSTEEPVIVPRPWVTIIGGIQPDVLPEFGKERGDGLLERFVFAYPQEHLGGWSDDEVSDEALEEYQQTVCGLYSLFHAQDAQGDLFPSRVPLSHEAKELFIGQYNCLRRELGDPAFPQRLKPAWGKMDGLLAGLALILALSRGTEARVHGLHSTVESVTKEDMSAAIELVEYFKNHTRRVYAALYSESATDRFAADLKAFLVGQGGVWEGTATRLYGLLDTPHKPKRPEDLSKVIRAVARRAPLLCVEDLPRTQERRALRLTLMEN